MNKIFIGYWGKGLNLKGEVDEVRGWSDLNLFPLRRYFTMKESHLESDLFYWRFKVG